MTKEGDRQQEVGNPSDVSRKNMAASTTSQQHMLGVNTVASNGGANDSNFPGNQHDQHQINTLPVILGSVQSCLIDDGLSTAIQQPQQIGRGVNLVPVVSSAPPVLPVAGPTPNNYTVQQQQAMLTLPLDAAFTQQRYAVIPQNLSSMIATSETNSHHIMAQQQLRLQQTQQFLNQGGQGVYGQPLLSSGALVSSLAAPLSLQQPMSLLGSSSAALNSNIVGSRSNVAATRGSLLQPHQNLSSILNPGLQVARNASSAVNSNLAGSSSVAAVNGSVLQPPQDPSSALNPSRSQVGSNADQVDILRRSTRKVIFPEMLHRMLHELESCDKASIVSFVANGKAFKIHKPNDFTKEILPYYFPNQTRLTSFKKQLQLYGFELINIGIYNGSYYHPLFVRNQPELCKKIRRKDVKGRHKAVASASENTK